MHTAYLKQRAVQKRQDAGQTIRITNNSSFCQLVLHLWKAQNMGKSVPSDNTASNKQKCGSLYGCRHILNNFLLPFVTIIFYIFILFITMFYIGILN